MFTRFGREELQSFILFSSGLGTGTGVVSEKTTGNMALEQGGHMTKGRKKGSGITRTTGKFEGVKVGTDWRAYKTDGWVDNLL